MAPYTVRLVPEGIEQKHWVQAGREYAMEVHRPGTAFELLRFWHCHLAEIAPDYTFGDLVRLLRGVYDIGQLGPMLACDIEAFLAEADLSPEPDPTDTMQYVEVYNWTELTEYESLPVEGGAPAEEPSLPLCAEDDEPILQDLRDSRPRGRWVGPYYLSRGFHGWGKLPEPYEGFWDQYPEQLGMEGGFALEFMAIQNLLHYPLRYNPLVRFSRERTSGEDEDVLLEDGLNITFGEFVHAIWWELGFCGTPLNRDEECERLKQRVQRLKGDESEDDEDDDPGGDED